MVEFSDFGQNASIFRNSSELFWIVGLDTNDEPLPKSPATSCGVPSTQRIRHRFSVAGKSPTDSFGITPILVVFKTGVRRSRFQNAVHIPKREPNRPSVTDSVRLLASICSLYLTSSCVTMPYSGLSEKTSQPIPASTWH